MSTSNPAKSKSAGEQRPKFDLRLTLWSVTFLIAWFCVAPARINAATFEVRVGPGDLTFDPANVMIQPGDTVKWIWDTDHHTVTSGSNGNANGMFESGLHGTGFTFSFTFPNAGTFDYYCSVHFSMGMVGSVHVAAASPTVLGNISTRLQVQTGDNALIGGFIIAGTQPKKLILRAIGPSLPVTGKLADPKLELYDSSGHLLQANDNWQDAPNKQEIIDSTVAPSNDLESAILTTLPANKSGYTAVVRGVGDSTGVGLVEGYDLDHSVDSKLANISTRGLVQTGENVMIGGFIVLNGSQKVIVRAIGPSLPVTGKLADPTLELRDSNGGLLAANDNWRSDQEAEIKATTIPPQNDLESAIVATLPAANYTAIVKGVNSGTGIGLVEVYALDN